ncbi:MAG TPA: hypothetical protein VGY58_17750 [Gemmataceae bacterium]|nr:hypothetical protein [Gemmataceae bacterium]
MWTPLALCVALAVSADKADQLALTHVRTTHGMLGVPRLEDKVLPGDNFALAFDIEGITVNDDGKFLYSIGLQVTDAAEKIFLKQEPRPYEASNALGGNRVPAFANVDVGVDQPPGEYTLSVTVTDRSAMASKTLTRRFEVLDRAFGLVRLTTTGDPEGRVPLPVVAPGQTLWLNFFAVGTAQEDASHKCKLAVEIEILDAEKKPVRATPITGVVEQQLPEKLAVMPVRFMLPVNREGKFIVEIKATDQVSKKTAVLKFPITVVSAP